MRILITALLILIFPAFAIADFDKSVSSVFGDPFSINKEVKNNKSKTSLPAEESDASSSESKSNGWIGIAIDEVTPDIAKALGLGESKFINKKHPSRSGFARGAMVVEVLKNSPAQEAGIMAGDVIIKFDGHDIDEMSELPKAVLATPINKKVRVLVFSQEKEKVITIKVLPAPEDLKNQESEKSATEFISNILSIELAEIDNETGNKNVVEILSVGSGSKSEKRGLKAGDIILSANQIPVHSIKSLQNIILGAQNKKDLLLLMVKRKDQKLALVVDIK